MIAHSAKPETKPLSRKDDNPSSQKKSRLSLRSKPGSSKSKPETSSGPTSANPLLPNASPAFYISQPVEDPHFKLKLLELTPRNPATQTSQGVQEFIQQVSQFIEKKNPFNVAHEKTFCPGLNRSENDRHQRRPDSRNFHFDKNDAKKLKNHSEKPKAAEKSKRISGSSQVSRSRTLVPPRKEVKRVCVNPLSEEDGRVQEERRVRQLVGKSVAGKKEEEGKGSLKVVTVRGKNENRGNAELTKKPPSLKQSQSKRTGRSEIPLRKTRADASKNPKPVALLMQKPLKDVESAISIDFYSKKKPFTPIEELSLCSEIQSPNTSASSEKLNHAENKSSPETEGKNILTEEVGNGLKLDRCCKSPNIPVISNPSFSDVNEQKLCTAKRSKVLDLDKVRTSSFTVLRNSREALCRLESLHQQNVSTKENVFGEKASSSKLKILTPKSSFNPLKGKGSKKNLSTRSSSKGNKPALKIKTRKTKKDFDENLGSLKKSQKSRTKTMDLEDCSKAKTPEKPSKHFFTEVFNDEGLAKEGSRSRRSLSETDSATRSSPLGGRSTEKKEFTLNNESISSMNAMLLPKQEIEESEKEGKCGKNKKLVKLVDNGGMEQRLSKEQMESPTSPPEKGSEVTVPEANGPDGQQTDEDEGSSSKTVTLGGRLTDEVSSLSSDGSQTRCQLNKKKIAKGCEEAGLVLRATSLKFRKDEPPEKPEEPEPKKNKLHIKINLTTSEDTDYEETTNSNQSFDWLYRNNNKYSKEQPPHEGGSNDLENIKEGEEKSTLEVEPELLSREEADEMEGNEPVSPIVPKARKSSPFLRTRPQYKVTGANLKGVRKKKLRSDAGDRRLPSSTGFFKSVTLQSKIKLDTKLRSGLTNAYAREEKRDIFDETAPVKLKRRNSEPISFRGYIWKRADSVTPRGHKASVSSMASSLKHLNTDDIDDFIFWEAVPQKMTSCWEMSLYHFKRPWSVLSCSVFEDNRQSSTPGLILENLRNGGSLSSRRSALNSNERAGCPKDDPFDVEPSIAQKNIDIRNWLAALNFPTPPSTSTDVISEGSFSTQPPVDQENLSKGQANQKRKKVLPSLRFSDEATDKKAEEKESKYKNSTKWKASEVGGLMDLIRRKSGGFVTNEQFLNSEHSIHRPNVTVNLCLYSKTPEEKPALRETHDRNVSSEPKTFKRGEKSLSAGASQRGPPETAHLFSLENTKQESQPAEVSLAKEVQVQVAEEQRFQWGSMLKRELGPLPSDVNIWKYLFFLTIFIISVHYCFFSNSVAHN